MADGPEAEVVGTGMADIGVDSLHTGHAMSSADQQVYVLLSTVLGIVAVLWFLDVVLCLELVKNDLREACSRSLIVRWCPFGSWGGYYGCCFKVLYIDFNGLVHTARCWTGGFRRGVIWMTDEAIGEKPPEDAP